MKHSYFKIPGWFNYSETYDMIVDQIPEDGKIIEIGSFLGRSTHYLATSLVNANKENVKIYCVDTFAGSPEHVNLNLPADFSNMFKDNLRYFIGRNMVHVYQGRSDDTKILEQFEEASIDYIMVDGAHEYEPVIDDIQNWWSKLKPSGVMFGDDYQLASVSEAVKKTLPELMAGGLGVNGRQEQTWDASKDDAYKFFEKTVPGVNCLK